jgi:hypothetical protein
MRNAAVIVGGWREEEEKKQFEAFRPQPGRELEGHRNFLFGFAETH